MATLLNHFHSPSDSMGTIKIECVVKERNEIGEGPVWEEKDATLLYVDIYGPKICRWNSLTNQIESMHTGEPVTYQLYFDFDHCYITDSE